MVIDERVVKHIKKDAIATIGTDGLVGNMIVNIIPGDGDLGIVSEGDVIKSYSKIGTSEMLSTLNVTNENAALLTADLLKITNSINKGEGTLGILIKDSILADNFRKTIYNLKISSQEASETIKKLSTMVGSVNFDESIAGIILNDTIQAEKLKGVLTNLDDSSQSIKIILNNLNETLVNAKEGEGAINYLSNNPEFVEQLEQIIKSINEGTDKFNQNMEALKHNFLTRGYFRKLERQQKNEAKKDP